MITVPRTTPPAILYKYYPPERVDVLQTQELRFSSPSSFNDVFDSHHELTTKTRAGKKQRILLRNQLGVFCMTEDGNNHQMWATYAKSHTGFLIGFDATSTFFDEDKRELRKVIYQPNPPIFDAADENACFYKSVYWQGEEEWRCVRRFDKTESRAVSFTWPLIREVIFGYAIESQVIAKIAIVATILSEECGFRPAFYKARLTTSEWRLDYEPKQLSMCKHCSGEGYCLSDAVSGAKMV